jgi:hypothetical protein
MNTTYALSSQLDLFRGPVKQVSQEKNALVPHYPLTTLSGGPIEFDVPPSPMYTDLSETRLYIKCRIVTNADANLADDATVYPVNMMFHALFSKVDVLLNGRLITQSADTYPWKAALETLLNFGKDAKESQLSSIGYVKDEIDASDNNTGKAKRKRTKEFELIGPLHVDLFFQEKYLINGVPMRIKLTRTTPSFCLEADGNDTFKLNISQAILYVRRVKVSPTVEIAHAKAIEKCNALYPMHNTELVIVPVTSGLRTVTKDTLFAGRIPRKLVIAMISSDSYNGTTSSSPFRFVHSNLSRVDITFEGETVADTPLTTDFEKDCMQEHMRTCFQRSTSRTQTPGSTLHTKTLKTPTRCSVST